MTEDAEAPEGKTPFEEHALYQTAMRRLAKGDLEDAAVKLNRLAELYPEEEQLRDQAVRAQLMAALADGKEIPVNRARPAPILRNVLLLLLAIAVVVVGVAAFTAAYEKYVIDARKLQEQEAYLASRRQVGQNRLQAGDTQGAKTAFQEVLAAVPADPTAVAGLAQVQQQEKLDDLCKEAQAAEQQGDVQSALDLYRQIDSKKAGFCSAKTRIQELEKRQSLDTLWQGAQNSMGAGALQDAISQILEMRKRDIDFHRAEAEGLLFQAYTQLASQQLSQANGDLTQLRQALDYCNKALGLRPTDQNVLRECGLAQGVVSGFEAYAAGDWAGAIAAWEPVHASQPDYQGGILIGPLQEAYPKAAQQLLSQANGNVTILRQAIVYLDKALATQPGNQSLVEQRQLATEYVAGADAAAQERWEQAIQHWSAIYAGHPDYQQGVLGDQLRQVCTDHPEAGADLCPP
jgi:outer membrane protein assembly factor BamD (BamD/ComL family)